MSDYERCLEHAARTGMPAANAAVLCEDTDHQDCLRFVTGNSTGEGLDQLDDFFGCYGRCDAGEED